MESNLIYVPISLAIIGLVFMLVKMAWVKKQNPGNEKMQSISKSIKEGAMAFLSAEYRLLAVFVVIASAALFGISTVVETTSWMIVPAFVVGAVYATVTASVAFTTDPKVSKIVEPLWETPVTVTGLPATVTVNADAEAVTAERVSL